MKQIQRQGIVNSVFNYLGIALGYLNIGILFPMFLEPEEVGLIGVMLALANIVTNIAKAGAPNIVIRYFPFHSDSAESKSAFLSFLLMLTVAGSVFFTLLYMLAQPWIHGIFIDQSRIFLIFDNWVVPMAIIMAFFELFFNYCRSLLSTVIATVAKELMLRLVVTVSIVLLYFGVIAFPTFVYIYALSYVAPTLLLIAFLAWKGEFKPTLSFDLNENLNRSKREMIGFGAFVFLGSMATMLLNDLDKVMLGSLVGLDAAGVYSITAFFGAVIMVPSRSIMMISAPILANYVRHNELEKIEDLYKKVSINLLVAGLLIYVGICINLHNVFKLLPPEYEAGRWVIVFIGLSKIIDMSMGLNSDIILNSRFFRYDLYFNSFLVIVAIVTNLVFIPLMGMTGAAIATALSLALYNLAKSIFSWRKFRIQPYTGKTLVILLIAAGVWAVNYPLPVFDNLFIDIAFRSSIVGAVYLALVFLLKVSPQFNELLFGAWQKLYDRSKK